MRSSWKSVVLAVAALLVTPQLSFAADEVEEQLRLMQEQLNRMEDQLQATNDELDSSQEVVERQQSMIEKAGLDERAGKSSLSRFLEQTEFDGWVSVNWAWNFNGPPNDQNVAVSNFTGGVNSVGFTAPLHRDHNTFNLDQLWFAMRKEATEESRAGFSAQMAYGRIGDILGGTFGGPTGQVLAGAGLSADTFTGNGNSLYIYEAYVEYLAPIWNGVTVTAGRFGTNIGYETIRAVDQPFITRGTTWAQQPIAHTGLKLDVDVVENLNLMVGAVNNINDWNFETDNEKTFIGSLAYTGENFGVSLNGLYGGDFVGLGGLVGAAGAAGFPNNLATQQTGLGRTSDSIGILNVVGTYDPSENLHLFLDFNWITYNGVPQDGDPELYGLAIGGRYAINDSTGFSLRPEYYHWDNANRSLGLFTNSAGGGNRDTHGFAITGTIDHALTDQLTLTVEGRYDKVMVDSGANNIFTCGSCTGLAIAGGFGGNTNNKTDQVLALVQLLYRF